MQIRTKWKVEQVQVSPLHLVVIKSSITEHILILLLFWFVPLTKANINNQKRLSFLFILYGVDPMSSASCYVEVPLKGK